MKRNVFITGASSGIGKAAAHSFAKNGDNLILCARRKEKLDEIERDIKEKYGVEVHTYRLDVTIYENVVNTVKEIIKKSGKIDVLINNAGLALGMEKFHEYSINDMEVMLNTNVKGLLYVTREVITNIVTENSGHIINIGSTAGLYSYGNGAVYCATKAAVRFLSDGIRIDVMDKNIKVTTVQPGIVETDFSEVRFHGDKKRAENVYKGIKALTPEDIADTILYAANQPEHVQISDITIMATKQATGFNIHRE
ncbi:MAG: SDR family NAD(P)-dependent oxidoreductase [Leptotrichiaceae bacterium]|nr:SDR family NAD(P)-dependent oxidoreductase [Leptotrichiaceae bacterium]